MKLPPQRWTLILGMLFLLTATGCSGDMGTVTGQVTADGKPLEGALLEFFPKDGGRGSSARTDDNGEYELVYSREEMGAKVGDHLVQITTAQEAVEYGDKPIPETLPAKYNVHSELVRTVESGSNVINFELDYEGEVIQPPSGY